MSAATRRADLEERLAALESRVARLLSHGAVAEVRTAPDARARADVGPDADGAPVLTGWMPWMAVAAGELRAWSAPSAGERCLVLTPGGNDVESVILLGLHSSNYPAPSADAELAVVRLADGGVISYDSSTHVLEAALPDGAAARLEADLTVDGDITATGDVSAENVTASADVSAGGDVSDAAGDLAEMRSTYNAHVHPSSSGPTGPPTQKMT